MDVVRQYMEVIEIKIRSYVVRVGNVKYVTAVAENYYTGGSASAAAVTALIECNVPCNILRQE